MKQLPRGEASATQDDRFMFRRANADDASSCAALIYSSGPAEFGYLFGSNDDECIAFLRHVFAAKAGRFSHRHHFVAVDSDGRVCAVLATHTRAQLRLGDLALCWQLVHHFGAIASARMLIRGHVLSSTLVQPNAGDILISHCATHPPARSQGIFQRLFRHVVTSRFHTGKAWLNVLDTNTDARRLYARLGFADGPLPRRRSAHLPAPLAARCMYCPPSLQENAS